MTTAPLDGAVLTGIGPQLPPTKNCSKNVQAMRLLLRTKTYAGTNAPPKTQLTIIAGLLPVNDDRYPTVVLPINAPICPTTVIIVTSDGPFPTCVFKKVGNKS